MHEKNSFITLTYNNENLPADLSIDLQHWQKFAKRLRDQVGEFRYLHCGEYGEKEKRPHYHACIFGMDFSEDREVHTENDQGDPLYISPTLDKIWGKGYCLIGDLTYESAGYVARYAMKKQLGAKRQIRAYGWMEHVDTTTGEVTISTRLKPPYVTMSRNPGLGSDWYDKYSSDLYPLDECIINGKKTKPPAFYDRLYEQDNPEGYQCLKMSRRKAGYKHRENNTTDRLIVRETIKESQLKQLKRVL